MTDDSSQVSDVPAKDAGRRRLLTLLGVGGVAAFTGSLAGPREAHAGHGGTNVLHLGEFNNVPVGSDPEFPHHTIVDGPSPGATLKVINDSHQGSGLEGVGLGGGGGVLGNAFAVDNVGFGEGRDAGVSGISSSDPDDETTWGKGPAPGVFGESGASGVLGVSQDGTGVSGDSENGTGGQFHSANGTALEVHGPARFSTAGSETVPAGKNSVFVEHPVTEDSHISVTLTSDPGPRTLAWVERASNGSGFTVHLSQAAPGPGKAPGSQATSLTYLVLEPASIA